MVEAFLLKQGLVADTWSADVESLNPHYDEVFIKDVPRQVQNGFDASQSIRVATKDLDKITRANKALLQLRTENHPVNASAPSYLVSLSLIHI